MSLKFMVQGSIGGAYEKARGFEEKGQRDH
jgi:hypothetical protein